MAKKLTIPCDRCGARLENIPEKCPHCGEIIRERMDPFVRARVEQLMQSGKWKRYIPALLTYFLYAPIVVAQIFVFDYFDNHNLLTILSVAAFAVVIISYYLITLQALRGKADAFYIGHWAIFILESLSFSFLTSAFSYFALFNKCVSVLVSLNFLE